MDRSTTSQWKKASRLRANCEARLLDRENILKKKEKERKKERKLVNPMDRESVPTDELNRTI